MPLPVELSSFTANLSGSDVKLNWRTESEVQNYGFEIERKADNTKDSVWKKIGFIEGHGNSNTPNSYIYTDKDPSAGNKLFYRLKQIDTDGNFEYSQVVEAEPIVSSYSLAQNYPNPFNPVTIINYEIPFEKTQVAIRVYDVLGNEVATLVNEEKPNGRYSVKFDGSNLASGVYLYKIQAANYISIKKMLLLK